MRVFLAALALALSYTLAAHAGWTEVAGTPGLRKYLDLDTAERNGAVVRVTELIDFSVEQPFSGERVLSIRWVNEYHCERRQTRVVSYEAFAQPMAQGLATVAGAEEVAWADVPDGSLASKVWSVLCAARWGASEATLHPHDQDPERLLDTPLPARTLA